MTVLARPAVSAARPPTRLARRRPTAHAPSLARARQPAGLQTTTTDANDRC